MWRAPSTWVPVCHLRYPKHVSVFRQVSCCYVWLSIADNSSPWVRRNISQSTKTSPNLEFRFVLPGIFVISAPFPEQNCLLTMNDHPFTLETAQQSRRSSAATLTSETPSSNEKRHRTPVPTSTQQYKPQFSFFGNWVKASGKKSSLQAAKCRACLHNLPYDNVPIIALSTCNTVSHLKNCSYYHIVVEKNPSEWGSSIVNCSQDNVSVDGEASLETKWILVDTLGC